MGYTHYWKFKEWDSKKGMLKTAAPKDVENASAKWAQATELIQKIIKKAEERGIKIAGCNGEGKPRFDERYISFNGRGENSHESFYLDYESPCAFDFCKTAREPYDLVVATSLLALKYVYGDNFEYSSDGVTRESIKDPDKIAYWERIGYTPKIGEEWEQAYELWEEIKKEI